MVAVASCYIQYTPTQSTNNMLWKCLCKNSPKFCPPLPFLLSSWFSIHAINPTKGPTDSLLYLISASLGLVYRALHFNRIMTTDELKHAALGLVYRALHFNRIMTTDELKHAASAILNVLLIVTEILYIYILCVGGNFTGRGLTLW